MLVAAVESLTDNMADWAAFHPEHWAELALNRDKVPLAPDYDRYRALDAAGVLHFTTLRDNGRMVGYLLNFLAPCLHYGILTATSDIYWTHPSIRGRFGGVRLFRAAQRDLAARGVRRWTVGTKMHFPADRLLRYLGFTPIETYHSKLLGE